MLAWPHGGFFSAIVSVLPMCALLAHGSAALGQAYPSKPVRFLSGQPPGGATDLFARMVAQKLNETWKQPVIIEHRPGASGSIAVELTVKSPPDGHTRRIAAQPEFQERLSSEGADHEAMTLERFAQFIRTESARWGKVIRERSIRAE